MNEDNRPGDDRLEAAVMEFRRIHVPERPADESVLARLPSAQREPLGAASSGSMKKAVFYRRSEFRYATAAAALVLAGFVGWLAMNATPAVVLAEVIKAAEKHKLVRYKQVQIVDDKTNGIHAETPSTVYTDLETPRYRAETRILMDSGEVVMVSVQDNPGDRWLMTNSQNMTATLMNVSGNATKTILDNLRDLKDNKQTTSENVYLDGRESVKYRLQDDAKITTTLWVDAKTTLPLRIECEMIDPTPDIALNKFVDSDFEWDPEATDVAQLFSTTAPDGYTTNDQRIRGKAGASSQ